MKSCSLILTNVGVLPKCESSNCLELLELGNDVLKRMVHRNPRVKKSEEKWGSQDAAVFIFSPVGSLLAG